MLDRRSEGEPTRHASLLTTHALRAVPVAEQLASGGHRHAHGTSNTSTSTDDDGHVAASALSAAQLAAARRQRLPARWQPVSVGDEQVSSRRPGSGVGAPPSTRPLHPPPRAAAGSASLHPSRSHVSNNVGHFGRRGEPVAGVPPELDPRASSFRPPSSPRATSIYSVSVQPPASPPSTVDDSHLPPAGEGADDEDRAPATPLDMDSALISSEAESLRGLSPPLISPLSQRVTMSTVSLGPEQSADTQSRRTSIFSGTSTPGSAEIPSYFGTSQPTRPPSATGSGYNSSLYPLRSTRFAPAPASTAATAGSERDSRSMVTSSVWSDSRQSSPTGRSVSSFEAILPGRATAGFIGDYQDALDIPVVPLPRVRARSISFQSESTASSSYGVGSAQSGTDSPYGDRGTSFAGTSIGAASIGSGIGMAAVLALYGAGEPILEEAEQRTDVSVSIAPSEAGSGADASELNAPPASHASLGYRRRLSLHRASSSIDEEGVNKAEDSARSTDPDDGPVGGDVDSIHHRATSIGAGSLGASPFGPSPSIPRLVRTNPGDMPLSLSLTLGPGLAAFRSAQSGRAPSNTATARTASPPRSVASATSESSLNAQRAASRHVGRTSGEAALASLSAEEYVARSDSELATAGSEESEGEGTDTEPSMQAQRLRTRLSYSNFPVSTPSPGWYGSEVDGEGHFNSIPGSWIDIPLATTRLSGSDPHLCHLERTPSEHDEQDIPPLPIWRA